VRINTSGSGHVGPGGTQPVPAMYVGEVERAISILRSGMREDKGCNDSFRIQPGGRDFKTIFDDASIWISPDYS
jgi:hypothetical protein